MPKTQTDDGIDLHYRLDDFRDPWIGDPGDTILLFPGFARNMKWWVQWVPALSRKYRVLRIDTRGCGESQVPPEGAEWSPDRIARDVLNVIDHLGIQKIHWVGFESGGLWGVVFAVNYPDRIKSLTLCNTPGGRGSGHFASSSERPSPGGIIKKMGLKQWLTETTPGRIDLSLADPKMVEWWIEENSTTPTEVAAHIMDAVDGLDVSGMHSKIRVPTLLMASEKGGHPLDEQITAREHIPEARLVVFPNIGEGIQMLIPDRCIAELLRFLE